MDSGTIIIVAAFGLIIQAAILTWVIQEAVSIKFMRANIVVIRDLLAEIASKQGSDNEELNKKLEFVKKWYSRI